MATKYDVSYPTMARHLEGAKRPNTPRRRFSKRLRFHHCCPSLPFHKRFLVSILAIIFFYSQLFIIARVNSAALNLQNLTSGFEYRNRWTEARQSKLRL